MSHVSLADDQVRERSLRAARLPIYVAEHRKQGDAALLGEAFGSKQYLFVHPNAVEQILTGGETHFRKSSQFTTMMKRLVGNGLITCVGESWRKQRGIVQRFFAEQRLPEMFHSSICSINRVIAEWPKGAAPLGVSLHDEMQRVAYLAILEYLFGADSSDDAISIRDSLVGNLVEISKHMHRFNIGFEWHPEDFQREVKEFSDTVCRLVAERAFAKGIGGDVLSLLIEVYRNSDGECDTEQVADELKTLLIVGNQSVGASLCWVFYLLSQHSKARSRIREEIDSILGCSELLVSPDPLKSLTYTKAVVQEAMRLYPPVWSLTRDVITDQTIMGHHMKAGSSVSVCQWITHRLPEFWEEPESFRPERFLDDALDRQHHYAYFPMGGGKRYCPAQQLTMTQMLSAILSIERQFEVRLVSDAPVEPVASFALIPKCGMEVEISRR